MRPKKGNAPVAELLLNTPLPKEGYLASISDFGVLRTGLKGNGADVGQNLVKLEESRGFPRRVGQRSCLEGEGGEGVHSCFILGHLAHGGVGRMAVVRRKRKRVSVSCHLSQKNTTTKHRETGENGALRAVPRFPRPPFRVRLGSSALLQCNEFIPASLPRWRGLRGREELASLGGDLGRGG